MKKKTLVPLIIFLLGMCLVGLIVYKTDTHEKAERHTTAQFNAATYGERIKNEIITGIETTNTLEQILISEDGEINHFDTIAENIISDSIASIQLAPDGIVTDIYPANGNEAGKIDLLHDKDRKEISCYARDHHTIITQGPFELKQGGLGIAVRNPVYLKDENGQEYFWGLPLLSSVFLIFFQTQLMRFQILDMNTDFQKQTHLGAMLIQLLSNRMVKCFILFLIVLQ